MTHKCPKYCRSKDILWLLVANGPLTAKTLMRVLNPPMKKKKLQMALSRLSRKGFIRKRHEKIFCGSGVFYQISQYRNDRIRIAKKLGCSSEILEQPEFRYRELIHNDNCALWMSAIWKQLPDAQIIRDFDFGNSELAQKIMSLDIDERDLRPDFLMILPNGESSRRPISIAVEIEKTRKTDKRIIKKLYKYANRSHVDGVIYVCENERLKDILQHILITDVLKKARRIEHYPQNFFLFSDSVDNYDSNETLLFNSEQKIVSLLCWVQYLSSHSFNTRRDHEIQKWEGSGPPILKELQ